MSAASLACFGPYGSSLSSISYETALASFSKSSSSIMSSCSSCSFIAYAGPLTAWFMSDTTCCTSGCTSSLTSTLSMIMFDTVISLDLWALWKTLLPFYLIWGSVDTRLSLTILSGCVLSKSTCFWSRSIFLLFLYFCEGSSLLLSDSALGSCFSSPMSCLIESRILCSLLLVWDLSNVFSFMLYTSFSCCYILTRRVALSQPSFLWILSPLTFWRALSRNKMKSYDVLIILIEASYSFTTSSAVTFLSLIFPLFLGSTSCISFSSSLSVFCWSSTQSILY